MSAGCRLTVTVRQARDAAEVAEALDLRVRVFCDEQGVSREEELDGLDDEATHLVALDDRGVVATCRLRFVDEGGYGGAEPEYDCKLERMAVAERARGHRVGAKLLARAEELARERGARRMVLNAQTRVREFYAGGGYEAQGGTFIEADIEHIRMTKPL